jgi:hypothetical protein
MGIYKEGIDKKESRKESKEQSQITDKIYVAYNDE